LSSAVTRPFIVIDWIILHSIKVSQIFAQRKLVKPVSKMADEKIGSEIAAPQSRFTISYFLIAETYFFVSFKMLIVKTLQLQAFGEHQPFPTSLAFKQTLLLCQFIS
jgi:hypothetical protein